jgi:hypothetical protein
MAASGRVRAVAVYLVVAFHAGWEELAGVGVDVFFVLSGFLVTRVLLADVVGGVRFARFYARPFRRLLPASFAVLVVTGVLFSAVAVADAIGGFRAAFLYVTNWYFIDQSANYFGADLESDQRSPSQRHGTDSRVHVGGSEQSGSDLLRSRKTAPSSATATRVTSSASLISSTLVTR